MIGSTLTTILVFVPLAFVRGVIGQFFQSLSLALSVALLVSMVISLTLVPVLAARFLGRRRMPHSGPVYNVLANSYEGLLRFGLRAPRTVIVMALLVAAPAPSPWVRREGRSICPAPAEGPVPWLKLRQAYGLLCFCERYGQDRVNALCERALAFDVIAVPRIEGMLKDARRTEEAAVATGRVIVLPARFARDAATFATRYRPARWPDKHGVGR